MFGWAITFLVIALIAGLLGFGVVAGTAFAAAKIIFVVALIAFLISGVLVRRAGPPSRAGGQRVFSASRCQPQAKRST